MCKKYDKALDNLYDKLRGENVTERRAIFTKDDNGEKDYLGFFAVIDSTIANFFDVDNDGKVHISDFVPYYGGMSNRRIANDFGAPGAMVCRC